MYYSEFGEDKWIAENIELPDAGFYVDVGCSFPGEGSNTAFLRERGWLGVPIDANPAYSSYWSIPFISAVISDEPLVRFECNPTPGHSRITRNGVGVIFATTTLDRILDGLRSPRVDFLSIDCEGAEFSVLKTLSLEKYKPRIIVSEYDTEGIGVDMRVRDYLLLNGYALRHTTKANHIFVNDNQTA